MNELAEQYALNGAGGADKQGLEPKSRPIYDKSASEATRELRDTSRRRRAAEEKLQQHLIQAKDHVPHHHDSDVHEAEAGPDAGQGYPEEGRSDELPEAGLPEAEPQEKDSEGDAR